MLQQIWTLKSFSNVSVLVYCQINDRWLLGVEIWIEREKGWKMIRGDVWMIYKAYQI